MYSYAHARRNFNTGKRSLVLHNTAPELLANHSTSQWNRWIMTQWEQTTLQFMFKYSTYIYLKFFVLYQDSNLQFFITNPAH